MATIKHTHPAYLLRNAHEGLVRVVAMFLPLCSWIEHEVNLPNLHVPVTQGVEQVLSALVSGLFVVSLLVTGHYGANVQGTSFGIVEGEAPPR